MAGHFREGSWLRALPALSDVRASLCWGWEGGEQRAQGGRFQLESYFFS